MSDLKLRYFDSVLGIQKTELELFAMYAIREILFRAKNILT